jgi:AcrR family transcriptional regulator
MKDEAMAKKEAIIKAAFKLFTERGFHGTPTSMISREAGIATGTLFRYFPTKEDLINSAYSIAKGHLAEAIKFGFNREDTLEGQLRHIWGNLIRWGINNPEEFLFIEQFASSPYITKLTEEEVMSNFEFLSDIYENGVLEGVIDDETGELLAEMIFDSNTAVIKKILRDGLQDDTEELIDRSFTLLWRGMGKS